MTHGGGLDDIICDGDADAVDAVTSPAIDPASPSGGAICRRRGVVGTGLLFRRRGRRRVRVEPPRVGSVVLVHDVVLVLVVVEETREAQSELATGRTSGSVRPSL